MSDVKQPVVTEDDVLRGTMQIEVETRDGKTVQANLRALSWAANCKVMALPDPSEILLHTILNGVEKEQANDEFLNKLTPLAIVEISQTVLTLTHGINALKKVKAARNSAQPVTPISTPPPADCANTDSAATK